MSENIINVPAAMPEGSMQIVSKKGKVTGTRYEFGGMSARAIREAGKSLGLKGRQLTGYVNRALTDDGANRQVAVAAAVAALGSRGYVADTSDVRDKTAVIRFVKPGASKTAESLRVRALEDEVERLRVALNAKLEATLSAECPTVDVESTTAAE